MKNKLIIGVITAIVLGFWTIWVADRKTTELTTFARDGSLTEGVVSNVLSSAKVGGKIAVFVGASPSSNLRPEFAPPTNSIAITNEAQLTELLNRNRTRFGNTQ